jgi:hypothetical protein
MTLEELQPGAFVRGLISDGAVRVELACARLNDGFLNAACDAFAGGRGYWACDGHNTPEWFCDLVAQAEARGGLGCVANEDATRLVVTASANPKK